ncbi:HDL546Cp [Eremothecium sinecaudum]|uniref:rRNA-processing protein FYV7 n=1 Tax=Eremothecium sinecaudum TaxID=45286 RepID=A0A0X8HRP9_9SACH|nr:HDL546Cp [Eremothecium sinecaudum]AMD20198.1 HDL546Cp [Eremothecium sinecaudum]
MAKIEKKYTKEYKIKEIQKNLLKRARLKKQYLKSLKEEGYELPEKQTKPRLPLEQLKKENKRKVDEKKEFKRQRKQTEKEKAEKRRQNEVEKVMIAKQKQEIREKKREKLTRKTRTGQPLMGPKIGDLLDKIKNDSTYTS